MQMPGPTISYFHMLMTNECASTGVRQLIECVLQSYFKVPLIMLWAKNMQRTGQCVSQLSYGYDSVAWQKRSHDHFAECHCEVVYRHFVYTNCAFFAFACGPTCIPRFVAQYLLCRLIWLRWHWHALKQYAPATSQKLHGECTTIACMVDNQDVGILLNIVARCLSCMLCHVHPRLITNRYMIVHWRSMYGAMVGTLPCLFSTVSSFQAPKSYLYLRCTQAARTKSVWANRSADQDEGGNLIQDRGAQTPFSDKVRCFWNCLC